VPRPPVLDGIQDRRGRLHVGAGPLVATHPGRCALDLDDLALRAGRLGLQGRPCGVADVGRLSRRVAVVPGRGAEVAGAAAAVRVLPAAGGAAALQDRPVAAARIRGLAALTANTRDEADVDFRPALAGNSDIGENVRE
jgi:hypothetical protein